MNFPPYYHTPQLYALHILVPVQSLSGKINTTEHSSKEQAVFSVTLAFICKKKKIKKNNNLNVAHYRNVFALHYSSVSRRLTALAPVLILRLLGKIL